MNFQKNLNVQTTTQTLATLYGCAYSYYSFKVSREQRVGEPRLQPRPQLGAAGVVLHSCAALLPVGCPVLQPGRLAAYAHCAAQLR